MKGIEREPPSPHSPNTFSTQATTNNVKRLLLVHNDLTEILGADNNMSTGEWQEESNAVAVASTVVAVSQHAAKDFARVFSHARFRNGTVADDRDREPAAATMARPVWSSHAGVDTAVFHPRAFDDDDNDGHGSGNRGALDHDIERFRRLAGLDPDTRYVMVVGSRKDYNSFRAACRALGLAAGPTATTVTATRTNPTHSSNSSASAMLGVLALVLVGGGPVTPTELELLADVGLWSHVGFESGAMTSPPLPPRGTATSATPAADERGRNSGGEGAVVNDSLLAAGYSGAVALLHLSQEDQIGLSTLEAFACGCLVVAVDTPLIREIAGLPNLEDARRAAEARTRREELAAAPSERELETRGRRPASGVGNGTLPAGAPGTMSNLCGGASSCLEGGLVLVEDPESATQAWRAVRAVAAMEPERRAAASQALVRRAEAFDSWQPLADTLIKAAVE